MPTPLRRMLRITPQQLRAFEASARLGGMTRASEELHVSQPTISVQLKQLSQTIGEPLIHTRGRQLRLTPAGEALQETIGEIRECWQRLESRLADARGLVSGRLRIAAVTTAEYFVPDLLGPFAAAYPGVDIELAIENRERVVERLQARRDDLAVMMLPPESLPLACVPFLDNPLVVVASARHPLRGQRLQLAQLDEQRWLMREQGSGTRRVAEHHFKQHGFQPRIAMSLGSNEAIKHAAAAGLGIAVLSRLALADIAPIDRGAIPRTQSPQHRRRAKANPQHPLCELRVSGFPLKRRWFVVWRQDQQQSTAARRFVDYLQAGESRVGALQPRVE